MSGQTGKPLTGRVVLVTGAGGGLGSAVALAAAQAGAELILCGRRQAPLERTYDAIADADGPQPALFPMDFTKAGADDYRRLVDGIRSDCGRLDGIVHLAGRFDGLMPFTNQSVADWQRSLHVNLTAPFAVTQACLPLLSESDDASVIFTSDSIGREPKAFWGGYAVAKAGLDSLVTMLAQEMEHSESLRINAVDPGPTATPLRARAFPTEDPQARPPEQVLAPFLYLLGPESRGSNGQTLRPDTPDVG